MFAVKKFDCKYEKQLAAASVHLPFIRICAVALEMFTITETLTKN